MGKNQILPITILVLLISSCSSSNDVVQRGILQHRKYNKPGWFIDMPTQSSRVKPKKIEHRAETPITKEERSTASLNVLDLTLDTMAMQDVAMMELPAHGTTEKAVQPLHTDAPVTTPSADMFASVGGSLAKEFSSRAPYTTQYMDRINAEAAPGPSENVGGVNIFALLGFIFAFVFPLAGLVLSIIGLNKTRGGGNGHGLALAGLIISIVFLAIYGVVVLI